MKSSRFLIYLVVVGAVLLASCKRDMFDADAYKELIQEMSPIDSIDANHTWELTTSHATVVTANLNKVASYEVSAIRILSGNPFEQENVEILAESEAAKDTTLTLFYYAPIYQHQLYAAVVTREGKHYLKKFDISQSEVTFANDVIAPDGEMNKLVYQTYTYCFEENYPEPSEDWDFNDLVLRVQKLPAKGENQIRLTVTLAAVGGLKQMAAAIHLLGYQYDDVESVYIEEGRTFDGAFNQQRTFITSSDLLLRGIHGEAVLNLFEDAHYAMSPRLRNDGMGVIRMYYNTMTQVTYDVSAQLRPKTLTYVVQFKNPRMLHNFTLESIDPFVMEDFNSGKWEIHTFSHKADQIFSDFGDNETAKSNNMTWSLKIPMAAFRWPIEGQNMGLYKDGVLTGAYMNEGHSYGQWVVRHTTSLDWFLYPMTGMVY